MNRNKAKALTASALMCTSAQVSASPCYAEVVAGLVYADRTVEIGQYKLIDQGGDALLAGLRAGWSTRHSSGLAYGVEAEAMAADGRSRINTAGLFDSRRWHGTLGAFARVGYAPTDTALIFARVGLQHWLATTESLQGVGERADYTVPAIGAGALVSIGPHAYGRVDFTYSNQGILDEQLMTTASIGWRW